MPAQELTKTDEEKMVDLDVSGPAVDVELPQEGATITEVEQETVKEEEQIPQVNVKEVEQEESDELESYSKNVKARINKLTGKLREAERREKAATEYAQNVKTENTKLKTRNSALDGNYIVEFANRITTETEAAKAALKAATEMDDVENQVEAQQKLARLAVEAQNLKAMNVQRKRSQAISEASKKGLINTPVDTASVPTAPTPPDPKAEAWAEKNNWFGSDTAMTMTSFVIHRQLTEEEGFDASEDQYYDEIDKRIRTEFPHKFSDGGQAKSQAKMQQTVAPAGRSSSSGKKRGVRLTKSEVEMARRLNVPVQEYAKHIKR